MKKMTKAMLMTALICGTMYCGAEPVHANELDTFTLDEYVVTAARTETKLVDTPANITVITAEQIESRHYTDVAEVMKDVPGANVLDNGTGTSEKAVLLNGDERVLILVDGRRMNIDMGTMSGNAGFDMNQLPDVNLIERIEVMKGAGGALYGSDAVGGVINVITKKGAQSYGKVSVGFGSNGTEDLSAMYYAKAGKTGVSVSAAKYKQDYYKYRDYATDTTKRWPTASDYENEKVSLRIDQELTNDSNFTIGYDYSKFEGMSPYSISVATDTPENGGGSSLFTKETKNLYAKYDWTLNEKDQGYLQFYHNEYEAYSKGLMEEKTNGFDIQQTVSLSDTNKMVVGMSWRKSDVETTPVADGGNKYDESVDNLAIFVNDTWEFAPTWNLNAGVRYDSHSEAGNETTLSAGVNKKFNDDSHAYINWSQVFRAPTTDDLFFGACYDYGAPYYYYGNPDLVAETGDTWTIGYETKLNEKTNVGISYFKSDIDDAIDWDETFNDIIWNDQPPFNYISGQSITEVQNIDKQKKKGLELNLRHELNNNVELTASYTYLKVENNNEGKGFERDWNYMPNTYRLGLHYNENKWDANLWLRAGSGGSTHKRYSYPGSTYFSQSYLDSSYVTVDMAVTYKADKNLKVFAKAYNLFNEAYCEYAGQDNGSYDRPAQSRRFLIGAEYSF